MAHRWFNARYALLLATVAGLLVLPVAGYLAGDRLIGAYAGPRGIASYLGSLYGDALSGRPLALGVLLGPVLACLVWWLRGWLLRRAGRTASKDE
jgi:hypothetical protein